MQPPTPTNVTPQQPKASGGKKFLTILSWIFGIFFVLIGLAALASKEIFASIFTLIAGVVFIPPIAAKLSINKWVKMASVIIWFVVIAITQSASDKTKKENTGESQQTIQQQQPAENSPITKDNDGAVLKKDKPPVQPENIQSKSAAPTLTSQFISAAQDYYAIYKQYRNMCYSLDNTPMAQKAAKFQNIANYYQNKLVPSYQKLGKMQERFIGQYGYPKFSDLFISYSFLKTIYDHDRTSPDLPDMCDL